MRGTATTTPARHEVLNKSLTDVFLAPGQGVSSAGALARTLETDSPSVGRVLLAVDEVAENHGIPPVAPFVLGHDLSHGPVPGVEQLAHYATAVVLLSLLAERGVRPDALVAQSLGESAALVASGVYSVEAGAAAVCLLSEAYARHPSAGGLVMAVTDEEGARALVRLTGSQDLVLAGINAPRQTILSGGEDALETLMALEGRPGVPPLRRLPVPYLTHHPRLGAVARRFESGLRALRTGPLQVPVYSVVARRWYTDGDDFARALANCVTEPMYLREGLEQFDARRPKRLVELGPGDMATRTARSVLRGLPTIAPLANDTSWEAASLGRSQHSPCSSNEAP